MKRSPIQTLGLTMCALALVAPATALARLAASKIAVTIRSPAGGATVKSRALTIRVDVAGVSAISRVEVQIDGVTVATDRQRPYVMRASLVGLRNGRHGLSVVVYGRNGRRIKTARSWFRLAIREDRTPPSRVVGVQVDLDTQTRIALSWTAATDNVGVKGYEVYRDGGLVATVGPTRFSDDAVTCGQPYVYAIVAFDAAGNQGASSVPLTGFTDPCPDTQPPTAPADFRQTTSTPTTATLAWTASTDNTAVTSYTITRTGAAALDVASGATAATVTGLACATSYDFSITAHDAAGNTSPPATVTATTGACAGDTQPPTAPGNVHQTGSAATTVTLAWTASTDNTAVTGYTLTRTGSPAIELGATATQTTVTGLACATSYDFSITAHDAAGNVSPGGTATATTAACTGDTEPPTAPGGLHQSGSTTTGITLTWTRSTDNVAVTGYLLVRDGTTSTALGGTRARWTVAGLTCATTYSFVLTAGDAAGNVSPPGTTTATTSACTDTQPPTAPSNLHQTASTSTTITLTWTAATDNTAVTGYSIARTGAPAIAVSGTTTQTTVTGLTCATTYSFTITAQDAAGNTSASAGATGITASCGGSGITVAVDPATSQGTSKASLSTQLVYHGVLEAIPGGAARLGALQMPLIRIHAGTDAAYPGSGPELPEGLTKGAWSFSELDSLVNAVYAAGSTPIMNVRYAPNWMWTCSQPFAGGAAGVGALADQTYATFGDYLARLVSYYNTGTMTTDSQPPVTITNPAGKSRRIDYWEIWNEPDLSNETPCHPSGFGPALTRQQYIAMWNVVAPKMRAVDPTIKLVGPTVANPNQPGYAAADDYLGGLMTLGSPTPDALSFHSYGYWDNTATDQTLFDGDASGPGICCGGIPELVFGLQDLRTRFPSIPVMVTEENVNADYGDDPYGRPWGAFGVAWGASAFRALVLNGGTLMHQYQFAESPQFGYLDPVSGVTYLSYWRDRLLVRAFPTGSTIVSSTSSAAGIETLAVRRLDGALAVLVIDRQVDSAASHGGAGKPADVTVNLGGALPSSVTVTRIDAGTGAATGPVAQSLGAVSSVPISFGGYGMAVIEAAP